MSFCVGLLCRVESEHIMVCTLICIAHVLSSLSPSFKSLQPGLVKGHWTKEEDDRIVAFASSGNEDEKGNKKWSELRLPGRVGEQVKARWENILDPSIKKGAWTEDEMAILRSAQKELGNKVSVFSLYTFNSLVFVSLTLLLS